jgi:hypothetical protein
VTGRNMPLISASDKAKYFWQRGLTRIPCDCLSGKSVWEKVLF